MYGRYQPLEWSTESMCKVRHVMQYDAKAQNCKTPVIIEPNDNGWTPLLTFGWKPGIDEKEYINKTFDYLMSDSVSSLLVSDDVLEQLIHVFGDNITSKCRKYIAMRCDPVESSEVDARLSSLESNKRKLRFLAIASDYNIKCVDYIINAWKRSECENSELTIVIPPHQRSLVGELDGYCGNSIRVIHKAPLHRSLLKRLLRNHDISVCLTWADGGANAFEALEYGHAVITTEYHRSSYICSKQNGIVISKPCSFYDIDNYNKSWTNLSEYMAYVKKSTSGYYPPMIDELVNSFRRLSDDMRLVREMSLRSHLLSIEESFIGANSYLRKYYGGHS